MTRTPSFNLSTIESQHWLTSRRHIRESTEVRRWLRLKRYLSEHRYRIQLRELVDRLHRRSSLRKHRRTSFPSQDNPLAMDEYLVDLRRLVGIRSSTDRHARFRIAMVARIVAGTRTLTHVAMMLYSDLASRNCDACGSV